MRIIMNKNKLKVCVILFILGIVSGINYTYAKIDKQVAEYTSGLPFAMPEIDIPEFPDNVFSIVDFGAIGNGHTKNSDAFNKAIQACAEAGGGKVIVPPGMWLTGSIKLESNVNLHLQKGAIIIFSKRFEDYPIIRTSWEGIPRVRCTSPISGFNLENIAITGQGVIDGSGEAWRPVKKFKLTEHQWQELVKSGGAVNEKRNIWWSSEEVLHGEELIKELSKKQDVSLEEYEAAREYLRPVMVGLVQCKRVLLDGPTFQNSPAWNIHPLMCEDMVIRNIIVRNPYYAQNGDGLDIESCKNVVVYKCRFDVGDDAICLKSGKNEYGRQRGKPSENIIIADCIVYHGHGGFTVGSEMSGGVRNIAVHDCMFLGTDVGLRFKTTRGRGGIVENIYIQNILMKDIPTEAIRFNMYYDYQPPIVEDNGDEQDYIEMVEKEFPVDEGTPRFQKIYIKNVICEGADRAMLLRGLPEMPIREIELDNVFISADKGITCIEAEKISFNDVTIIPEKSPVFKLYNCSDISLQKVEFPEQKEVFIKLEGEKTGNIQLKGIDKSDIKGKIKFDKNVKSKDIILK